MKKKSLTTCSKIETGIQGFDEISCGGLPRTRTTLVMGGAGCGKTVFALQCLANGAHHDQGAALFVAIEETTAQILSNAAAFGWDLPRLIATNRMFFLDAQLSPEVVKAGEFDLIGMLSLLGAKAKELNATRIVFDGVDVLLGLLDDPIAERREVYRIRDWLAKTGLTCILTQKVGGTGDQRYSFLQFMVDCVVVLGHTVVDGSAFRNLRIVKYRGSSFSGDEFPISLSTEGLQLSNRGPTELHYPATTERVSSGVARLDHMLQGGYYRGSSVLVSGAPGSAKSTLAGLFAAAACARGEATLYISFDEGAAQIVRNLSSVGIDLAGHQQSGLLEIFSTRTRGPNIDDQFRDLRAKVRAHEPRCMVIDPLSALSTKSDTPASTEAVQHFLDFLRSSGITVVSTSLMDGLGTDEVTATGISTIADTWIHLSYLVQDGERNRALTIVKSRGTGHSNQVRELTLSDSGVSLTDVFVAQGRVLMGVARWEREQEEQAASERVFVETERKRLVLQLAQDEAIARIQVVKTEMEARSAELAVLAVASSQASKHQVTDRAVLRMMRHADDETAATNGTGDAAVTGVVPTVPRSNKVRRSRPL